MEKVGEVTHYYTRIGVAVIRVTAPMRVGDRIAIKGHTTNFEQAVESMQIEHEDVEEARPGELVGLKVVDRVRKGDIVYKVLEE